MAKKRRPAVLSALRSAPFNPRTISKEAAGALARSMKEFGDLAGLTYNIRTRHLITGHQRKDQLPKRAQIVRTDDATDDAGTVGYGYAEAHGTRWPVRFVDWPEATEKAANVAANSPLLAGEFTPDLRLILEELKLDLPDLTEELRFAELEIPELELNLQEGMTDPDAVPEPPEEPVSEAGGLWALGEHRLLCGDAGKPEDLDRLLAGAPVHLVNTDPPYNVRLMYRIAA